MLQIETQYKNNPTDQNFLFLIEAAKGQSNYSVIDFLIKLKYTSIAYNVRKYSHLAKSFADAGRYLESHHFCLLWQQSEPQSIDCWQLRAILAAYCCNIDELQEAIKKLVELKAPSNITWLALTLRALVFNNARQADMFAEQMLLTGENTSLSYHVALDAALRTESVGLFSLIFKKGHQYFSLTPEGEKRIRRVLARKILIALATIIKK